MLAVFMGERVMRIQRLPRGWVLDWFHGEVVVGLMDGAAYALLGEDVFPNKRERFWNQRTWSGRFFGFRLGLFVVSGWVA